MNSMEDGKKKIWACLLVVVLAAVVIGVIYYYSAPREQGTEGFLIRRCGRCGTAMQEDTQWEDPETREVCYVF